MGTFGFSGLAMAVFTKRAKPARCPKPTFGRPIPQLPKEGDAPLDGSEGPVSVTMPSEAPLFFSVEQPIRLQDRPTGSMKWFQAHPMPQEIPEMPEHLPGEVDKPTRRENLIRAKLNGGMKPSPLEFDKIIQVFAQRARLSAQWAPVQRREFIRRAKRWASEMVLQDMSPSDKSVKLILLGCEATGDTSGAQWWFGWMERYGRKLGRLHYNAVLGTFGVQGQPYEARQFMGRMREAGFKPDYRGYAAVIDAWEKAGNRRAMLQTILEMQEAEKAGELGEPLKATDQQRPYLALASSYAKVGDASRAISVLKVLQEKQVPMDHEVHRVRIEAHLRTPEARRSAEDIREALRSFLDSQRGSSRKPEISKTMSDELSTALGQAYGDVLREFGLEEGDVVPELPSSQTIMLWRRKTLINAMEQHRGGAGAMRPRSGEERFFRDRINARKGPKFGEHAGGYRIPDTRGAAFQGIKEWMTIPKPVKYG
mmetsp:Transcript_4740/g.11953  ORF Transcript_4740/g.11953 Transcript_4740/m.11953 type:complete len:482 (-) Transcript_4740:131-1576(-)